MTKTKQAKFLNLAKIDESVVRTLQIDGKDHPVPEMTVANFVETTAAAEALGENASLGAQMKLTMGMILRSIPTLKQADLDKLSMVKLARITAFVRGEDEVEEVAAEEGAEAGK